MMIRYILLYGYDTDHTLLFLFIPYSPPPLPDLVLYRYGSTGCTDTIRKSIDALSLIPVYPVRSITNFSSDTVGRTNGVFRDCLLVRPGTTVREVAALVSHEVDRWYGGAETVGGVQLGEGDVVNEGNNIIAFSLLRNEA